MVNGSKKEAKSYKGYLWLTVERKKLIVLKDIYG